MSDEQVVTPVKSAADPEVQAKAEKLGWIPPKRFKGDPERFVDAEEYIERGETVLPIVKEQNKRLTAEVETLRADQVKTQAALAAATKAIEEIEERHTVATQKAVAAARDQLKAQLASASEAGDHEAVAEITERMVDLNKAEAAPPPKKEATAAPAPYVVPPDLQQWNTENEWFGKDKRKTALALGIAQDLREQGETSIGRLFFDKVKDELEGMLGTKALEPRGDKVEGGRNGSENETRSGARKGFSALPADAKAACDADARNFVGPAKKYKTQAEWRTRYAEIYFEQGA